MSYDKLKELFSRETPKETIEAEHARLWTIRRKLLVDLGDLDEQIDALDRLLDSEKEK